MKCEVQAKSSYLLEVSYSILPIDFKTLCAYVLKKFTTVHETTSSSSYFQ